MWKRFYTIQYSVHHNIPKTGIEFFFFYWKKKKAKTDWELCYYYYHLFFIIIITIKSSRLNGNSYRVLQYVVFHQQPIIFEKEIINNLSYCKCTVHRLAGWRACNLNIKITHTNMSSSFANKHNSNISGRTKHTLQAFFSPLYQKGFFFSLYHLWSRHLAIIGLRDISWTCTNSALTIVKERSISLFFKCPSPLNKIERVL